MSGGKPNYFGNFSGSVADQMFKSYSQPEPVKEETIQMEPAQEKPAFKKETEKHAITQAKAKEHKKTEQLPMSLNCKYVAIEKRTKRTQLVLQQSLFDRLKKVAKENKMSYNDFCHKALEEAANRAEKKK